VLALKLFISGLGFVAIVLATWWVAESSAIVTYGSFSDQEVDFSVPNSAPLKPVLQDTFSQYTASPRVSRAPHVGIQAGHWKNDDVPKELAVLSGSGPGARVGKLTERSVVLAIARDTADILARQGVVAEVLPSVVPPGYCADAFVAIHADANANTAVSGYKVAASTFDETGRSHILARAIEEAYGAHTGLPQDSAVTDRMQQYYAFNHVTYRHAVDPSTPAVILETGYLTNPRDRMLLHESPHLAADAIAAGILSFIDRTSGCRSN
jgi:N-acetylmuramoyl-L-alanine amidase